MKSNEMNHKPSVILYILIALFIIACFGVSYISKLSQFQEEAFIELGQYDSTLIHNNYEIIQSETELLVDGCEYRLLEIPKLVKPT